MTDPVAHLLCGPNGAGKSTLFEHVIGPATRLPFVNADVIAARRWPGDEERHGLDASHAAAAEREALIARRASFVTETVFSHPSKVELVESLCSAGYRVHLHVIVVPLPLSSARVANRVEHGGHSVPSDRIRDRYARLWPFVVEAIGVAQAATVYDNSLAKAPFRVVAEFLHGRSLGAVAWPDWAPHELVAATSSTH